MRRPGRRARRVIAGALTVAVVGVGYAAYAASADDTSYRTVAATVGDVEQTLELSGAVEPAGRADLAFATSGTVEDVSVDAGDKVKAGEVLGTLDDTSLRTSVQQARATLAQARAQLEDDEDSQAATVSSASSSSSSSSTTPSSSTPTSSQPESEDPPAGGDTGGDTSKALAELADQQRAVTSAQSVVSASLTAARDALTAQQTACATAFSSDPGTDPSADPTADPGTSDDATNQACADALAAVQTAQTQVSTDQDALQVALTDLAGTLTAAVAGLPSGGDEPSTEEPSTDGPSTGQPTTQEPTTQQPTAEQPSSSPSGGMTITAATLARDQAAIDQAEADLIVAEQELRMATVTAPFAGEIVAVDAAEGDSVASGTEVFVLVSRGTTTVQIAATSAEVQQLAVGQKVTATPAGSDQPLAGTVTQISTVPDDESTYPVTITLARKNLDIATGLNASVSVVTGAAEDVVTVPASAVTNGSVTVQDGDTVTRTRVTTGVVGATTVEVTDGLEAGEVVVLADLDQALPTTDDSSNQRRSFGGGGMGGNGGPPPGVGGPVTFRQ